MKNSEKLHTLINIRASHIIYNGKPRFEGYRQAVEAAKKSRWLLENLIHRMNQGSVGDGNYGKGQG